MIFGKYMTASEWFEIYYHEPAFELKHEGYVTASSGPSPDNWLFAVDDGSSNDVMLSAEFDGNVYMARIEPTSGNFAVAWTLIDLAATQTHDISDHWHVFAHGYHRLSCNCPENDQGLGDIILAQVDSALSTAAAPSQVQAVSSTDSTRASDAEFDEDVGATNDHFMVEMYSGLGVVVGHFNNADLRIVFFDKALGLRTNRTSGDTFGDVSIGIIGKQFSAGGFAFREPASADFEWDGKKWVWGDVSSYDWNVMAPNTMNWEEGGPLRFWRTADNSWSSHVSPPVEVMNFEQSGYHIAMPYVVRVGLYWVMTYRRVATDSGNSLENDNGDIVRDIYNSNWVFQRQEVLLTASASRAGNRPHCQLWRGYLITCWDEWDAVNSRGLGIYMRVEELM